MEIFEERFKICLLIASVLGSVAVWEWDILHVAIWWIPDIVKVELIKTYIVWIHCKFDDVIPIWLCSHIDEWEPFTVFPHTRAIRRTYCQVWTDLHCIVRILEHRNASDDEDIFAVEVCDELFHIACPTARILPGTLPCFWCWWEWDRARVILDVNDDAIDLCLIYERNKTITEILSARNTRGHINGLGWYRQWHVSDHLPRIGLYFFYCLILEHSLRILFTKFDLAGIVFHRQKLCTLHMQECESCGYSYYCKCVLIHRLHMMMVIMFVFRKCVGTMLTIISLNTSQICTSSKRISDEHEQCTTAHIENELPKIRDSQMRNDQEEYPDSKDNWFSWH